MLFQAFVKDHLRAILKAVTGTVESQESFDNRLVEIQNDLIDIKEKLGLPVQPKATSISDRMEKMRAAKAAKKEAEAKGQSASEVK